MEYWFEVEELATEKLLMELNRSLLSLKPSI
jgi:hypothetical protein